jgi:EAL domain-containing protein (putative c-di-GMP-specific phosphodiesterase class I)
LTIPDFVVINANEELEEILKSYVANGVTLMVDSWNPATLPLERIQEFGFTHVRLNPELYLKREIADILTSLRDKDITAYAKDAETEDAIRWLVACGVRHFVSAATGPLVDEESLIRDSLLRERENA